MRSCCSLAQVPPRLHQRWRLGGSAVPTGHRCLRFVQAPERVRGRVLLWVLLGGESHHLPPPKCHFSAGMGAASDLGACGQAAGTGAASKQKSSYSHLPHQALP